MEKIKTGSRSLFFTVFLCEFLIRNTAFTVLPGAIETTLITGINLLIASAVLIPILSVKHISFNIPVKIMLILSLCFGTAVAICNYYDFYTAASDYDYNFFLFITIFTVVGVYAALLGSECTFRAGYFVFILLIASLAVVALFNISEINIQNLKLSLPEGRSILSQARSGISFSPLLLSIFIINPDEKISKKNLGLLLFFLFIFVGAFSFLAELVLGRYEADFVMPTHTLAVIGRYSIFRRFDAILSAVLLLCGMLKVAVLGASVYKITTKKIFLSLTPACAVTALLIRSLPRPDMQLLQSGITLTALFCVIFSIRKIKKTVPILLIGILLFFSGCSGAELKERGIVNLVFIDKEQDVYTAGLLVCTEYGEQQPRMEIIWGSGKGVDVALLRAEQEQNKQLYFGQNDVLLFGDGISRNGIGKIMPNLYRLGVTKSGVSSFLTRYNKDDIVENEEGIEKLIKIVEQQSENSKLYTKKVHQIKLNEQGLLEDILPVISLFEDSGVTTGEMYLYKDDLPCAVFKGNRYSAVAFLIGHSNFFITDIIYNQKTTVVKAENLKFKISAKKINDNIEFYINITGTLKKPTDKAEEEDLRNFIETEIEKSVYECIDKSIQSECDPFNLKWYAQFYCGKYAKSIIDSGNFYTLATVSVLAQIDIDG